MIDRSWTFAAATACGMLLSSMVGCSSTERELGRARVEPELSPPSAASPRPPSKRVHTPGSVPVVIADSRPYHTTARPFAGGRNEPRRLSPAGSAPRPSAAAHSNSRPSAADSTAIREMLASYLRSFNRHDSAALVAHWSESGESVDLDSGDVTAGREAVQDVFATLFAEDHEATIDIDVTSIRPVRADVAVVDGTSRITFGGGDKAGSRFSAVIIKQDDRWLLESVRESALDETASPARPLDQLAWLIGTWEDVGPGVTATTRCFWSAGQAFLIRTHAVTADTANEPRPTAGDEQIPGLLPAADVADREVTEIIGWDPETQSIRSWVFTSGGRFAEGVWEQDGDAWTVRMDGRGADTGRACGCTFVRAGADEVSVRGDPTGLAEVLAPVCDFVRIAR
ncbi:MAG: YybH family protein [Pirellulales bacterium]